MQALPAEINNVTELNDVLSRPSASLVSTVKNLDGDIMILGSAGKIGPTLARRARNAVQQAEVKKKIYAVDVADQPGLENEDGIETIKCDMLDWAAVEQLPRVPNIIFMAGRKFGSTGSEHLTWAINAVLPYHVARVFTDARIAVFSTGCVYPVAHVYSGGSTEDVPPEPVGEYAMSSLGRERVFDYISQSTGEKVMIVRLNYAVELRYGVLMDIAMQVFHDQPVDVTTGFANVIWQGDACDQIIRSLTLASSPPEVLNVTGPETFSVRQVGHKFGRIFGKVPRFSGEENGMAYLSNASRAHKLFGYPEVTLDQVVAWTADWLAKGGETLGKPTHFETQDGQY